jgi:hypothetical protein
VIAALMMRSSCRVQALQAGLAGWQQASRWELRCWRTKQNRCMKKSWQHQQQGHLQQQQQQQQELGPAPALHGKLLLLLLLEMLTAVF